MRANGDWLRAAVSGARWRCTRRRRPRTWYCGVPFQLTVYGAPQQTEIGYTVVEADDNDNQRRRNATVQRFHQTKQRMFGDVDEVLTSGRYMGIEYQVIGPVGVPMADTSKERRRAIAEEAIERDVEFEATSDDGLLWTVTHRPTGAFVFMHLDRPFNEYGREEKRGLVRDAINRLEDAIAARALPTMEEVVS